jgi:hypothetical protein
VNVGAPVKSRWFLNLVLAALAVALGVFAYLMPRSGERDTFALSTLAAREVTLIRIERTGNPATTLERKDERWQLTAPLAAPAEPFQVERLLAILSARSPQRMAPAELGRFDLDAPPMQLTFNTQTFGFGLVSTLTREQYVLTEGAVYVIAPRYGATVPVDSMQLVRLRLFADSAAPARFALPGVSLSRGDAGWSTTPPRTGLSEDDLNRYADEWRFATATRVARARARPALAVIQIEFKDGETVALDVVQREPALVLRRRDLELEYTLTAASAQRLLTPPGSAPH